MKSIDVHNHVGMSPDGGHGTIEEILKIMQRCQIKLSVVFATDEADKGVTFEMPNSRILALQKKYPQKIIAFTRIVPSAGKVAVAEFKRCCRLGAKGLKLKASDGFGINEAKKILDLIPQDKIFPVLMHTAHNEHSQPRLWEDVIAAYPQINFIMAHGGKDHHQKCAEIAARYANAFVETSTLSLNRTRNIYRVVGAAKLLYGSDYPYSHQEIELRKYELIVNNKRALRMILYDNAARLLGIQT